MTPDINERLINLQPLGRLFGAFRLRHALDTKPPEIVANRFKTWLSSQNADAFPELRKRFNVDRKKQDVLKSFERFEQQEFTADISRLDAITLGKQAYQIPVLMIDPLLSEVRKENHLVCKWSEGMDVSNG